MNARKAEHPALRLAVESKIADLLQPRADDPLEASGVCLKDGAFFVICDNSRFIAQLDRSLTVGHPSNTWIRLRKQMTGFEDITYDELDHRFLIVVEAKKKDNGSYIPQIVEFDDNFQHLQSHLMDIELDSDNKGIEGLTCVHRKEEVYVLGLCEGNKCKGGKPGRNPGDGRIHVFKRGKDQWEHTAKIKLPKSVQFADYAGIDPKAGRVVVVSQECSKIWIGELEKSRWDFVDEGRIYRFPTNTKGKPIYCNVEGVAWMSQFRIAVVSDKFQSDEQPARCCQKEQMIHIFDIPAG